MEHSSPAYAGLPLSPLASGHLAAHAAGLHQYAGDASIGPLQAGLDWPAAAAVHLMLV